MNRAHKTQITVVVLFTALALIVMFTSSSNAAAQGNGNPNPGPHVTIVSPIPLPVSGMVGLAPGGSVEIANLESSPVPVRDVDRAVREPFQIGDSGDIRIGSGTVDLVTVPDQRRLVIEHVSAQFDGLDFLGLRSAELDTVQNADDTDFLACLRTTQQTSFEAWSCSGQTTYQVEAGDTVRFRIHTGNPAPQSFGSFKVFISGYYVPVP